MEYKDRCLKLNLPDGHKVDLLDEVISQLHQWLQDQTEKPESCGYILGYENYATDNITITTITPPQVDDYRTRFFCRLRSKVHLEIIKRHQKDKNYYLGVWHTHPQDIPAPSQTDINEWRTIMREDKTGSRYVFYIIAGVEEFRVWVGVRTNGSIQEIFEADNIDGVYAK